MTIDIQTIFNSEYKNNFIVLRFIFM